MTERYFVTQRYVSRPTLPRSIGEVGAALQALSNIEEISEVDPVTLRISTASFENMVRRHALAASMVLVGAALIFTGWIIEDGGYFADLLLQLGSTALLIVPVLYIERIVERQLSEVRKDLIDLAPR